MLGHSARGTYPIGQVPPAISLVATPVTVTAIWAKLLALEATVSATPTAADNAAAVWAKAVEGLTAEQMLRVMLSALAGKRSGIGTATETYYGQDAVTPRITLTPDVNGNGLPVVNGAP